MKLKSFTIIELLLSLTIIALMAALSISSYPKFSAQIGVSTETYKILAYLREVQVYGISSYTEPGKKQVYGAKISKNLSTDQVSKVSWVNPTSQSNSEYIARSIDTGEAKLSVKEQYEISKICDDLDCTNEYDTAYVFYKRPNPEARLVGLQGTVMRPDATKPTDSLKQIVVTIRSKLQNDFAKKVVILQTGQMYVSDW